jgi:RimJ/RimL family protein N-acetyltransferase
MQSLDTDRLTIRQLVESDLSAVAHLLDACFGDAPRAHRAHWLAWTVRNYEQLAMLRQPPYGDYAVTLRGGAVIGAVGLVPSFGPFDRLPSLRARLKVEPTGRFQPELGLFWAIAPAHRRQGYATEATSALADFAFRELKAERLVATTEHDNAASIAVMRRIGMTVERNPEPEPAWFQTVGVLFNRASVTPPHPPRRS